MTYGKRRNPVLRVVCAGAVAMLPCTAFAQDKPLIAQWIDGEVEANFTEVTYDGDPIELRYGTFIREFPLDLKAFALLEEATNGKLVVKPYWGNSLADMMGGAFESVASGIVDFGNCYSAFSPGGLDLTPLLSTPFIFGDSAHATAVVSAVYPDFLKKEYESKGVYLQRVNMTRPANLLINGTQVDAFEDVHGKKILQVGGPYVRDMLSAMGMVPTAMGVPEVYPGLQTGVIDGAVNHDGAFQLFRWYEVADFHADLNLFSANFEYCLNKQTFDGLPDDLKSVFYHWSQLHNQAYAQLYYDAFAENARGAMQEAGIEFSTLSDEELAKFQVAVTPVVEAARESSEAAAEFLAALEAKSAEMAEMSADDITQSLLDAPVPGLIEF